MARIIIDCRLWGIKHTGLGRYTENLVAGILSVDKTTEYILLVRKEDKAEMERRFPGAKVVEAEAAHYTVFEQLLVPFLLFRLKPDLVHVPHFNIPVLWPGKMVVTIHDLITHDFRGRRQTTLPAIMYWPKYLVHLFVFWLAVKRAKRLVVPTKWAKDKLAAAYKVDSGKISVTSEAADPVYFMKRGTKQDGVLKKFNIKGPFLIYTGNTYEHKNLERLVAAAKGQKIKLVIACARSVFRDRFENEVTRLGATGLVSFLDRVGDEDLRELCRHSSAFVTPSLSEGFGLSGLEAMAAGTVVLSSRASCLPEVYGDCAIYFDPYDVEDMMRKIEQVRKLSRSERLRLVRKGIGHAKGFSWRETARLTRRVYEEALGD